MEWNTPPYADDIRQGDILMERPARGGTPVHMGVVVTADCDIAQAKFGNHLACLRIVWYPDYVRNVWSEGELKKLLSAAGEKAGTSMRLLHAQQLGAESTLTDTAALAWLMREDLVPILDALDAPAKRRPGLLSELGPIQRGLRAQAAYTDAFERCVAMRTGRLSEDRDKAIKALLDRAAGTGKLPEDVFFLPGLPGFERSPAIVLMRELVAVDHRHVVRASSDAVSAEHRVRVGRLVAPYKYALTQAFGHLYSRIGMPTEYELRRDSGKASILQCGWT